MHDRASTTEPTRLTYADFCARPDDGRRYEILDGELFMSPSTVPRHQRVVGRLFRVVDAHVERNDLGSVFVAPLDVQLSEHDIVGPDLVFVSRSRELIITDKNVLGAPDLAVEALSPGTVERDLRDKRNLYARCGVPFYWALDADEQRFLELELRGAAYAVVADVRGPGKLTTRLFPGLQINLADLWE